MKAAVIDPESAQRIGIRKVDPPSPSPAEALVEVKAFSLNRGELVYGVHGKPGTPLGWDLAGVVLRPAQDGSGPAEGVRVAGLVRSGAWAEQAVVPTSALAELGPSVTFTQAAALPMAGLTALAALEHGGSLIGRSVLVTGASGGVGLIACRLAVLAGAQVVGQVRQRESAPPVEATGAAHVVVDESVTAAEAFGPYDLIVEQLGGGQLAEAMAQLAPAGNCVSIGVSLGPPGYQVPIDMARMRHAPGASLRIFNLYQELEHESASRRLRRLLRLVSSGAFSPHIGAEAPWHEIEKLAQALLDREFPGKAVLHL